MANVKTSCPYSSCSGSSGSGSITIKRTPTFHTDYDTPKSHNDAIFESSDGTRFYFPHPLLIQLSSFFRNLAELPSSFHLDTPLPVYTLPSANSSGLAYTFDLILALMQGHHLPPFEVAPFEDVLVIADAYDLPLVASWLASTSVTLSDKDPFIPYTITSITGDQALADTAAKKALGRDVNRMPPWAMGALKRRAPFALLRLYEMQAQLALAMETFRCRAMGYGCEGGLSDFADACKEGSGCETFAMVRGDYGALRSRCAGVILESFVRCGARGMDPSPIKDVTRAMIWCETCQRRMEMLLFTAWRDTLGDLACSTKA